MKLKNFNWNEQSIDQVLYDHTLYAPYIVYASQGYRLDGENQPAVLTEEAPTDELSAL